MPYALAGLRTRSSVVAAVEEPSASRQYSMVLTNPPFAKKQCQKTVNEEGDLDSEGEVVVRQDFWVSTANRQLNFVQRIFALLKVGGRAAVVLPDKVLFEGGPGQKIRDQLLMKQRDVHTLRR